MFGALYDIGAEGLGEIGYLNDQNISVCPLRLQRQDTVSAKTSSQSLCNSDLFGTQSDVGVKGLGEIG